METRHIRLDYEDALNAKKELLSCQLNILQILKKIQLYKDLRNQEHQYKNKLRLAMRGLRSKTNQFLTSLPKKAIENNKNLNPPIVKKKKEGYRKESKQQIQSELDKIKEKLERLNQ
jgi:hypothetical protein